MADMASKSTIQLDNTPTDVKLLDPRSGKYIAARSGMKGIPAQEQMIVEAVSSRTFRPGDELLIASPMTGSSAIMQRSAMRTVRVVQQVTSDASCTLVLQFADQTPLAKSA